MVSGAYAAVDSVARVDSSAKVYNFKVAAWHNYFVASSGVLVHNTCPAETLYALRAQADGWYDFHLYGYGEKVMGQTYLKAGEVWKYGTSKNADTRYTGA